MKPNENRPRSNMKKFITIFISCSLALSAGAMAQQDEAQATPGKKKQQQHEKAHAAVDAQAPTAPQAKRPADRPHGGMKAQEHRNARAEAPANAPEAAPAKGKAKKARMQTEAPATEPANATTDVKAQAGQRRKDRNAAKTPETATANEATTTAAQTTQPNASAGNMHGKAKQLDTQTVQKIKSEHATFEAKARPQQVPAVTFSQSRTISGADQWQGQNYVAFRSYRPAMHDQSYYHSHFNRIELIGGGYYYFDAGYWYPAWGYQPSAQYYVYDGPIYAGRSAERLDRVIADVQASLQEQGYYHGEVDGLLGPLTREALTGYQTDHGLYTTAAIDEPTLNSLGMD
jgi:Putative peptidoglycan binding domain